MILVLAGITLRSLRQSVSKNHCNALFAHRNNFKGHSVSGVAEVGPGLTLWPRYLYLLPMVIFIVYTVTIGAGQWAMLETTGHCYCHYYMDMAYCRYWNHKMCL